MSNGLTVSFLLTAACASMVSCTTEKVDHAKPTEAARPGLQERLSENAGYKQNEKGEWVPKSDKRSSYDSQRDTPYFKDKITSERYKTGDYAKKSWWGSKEYGKKSYEGNTDGSRFRKKALQDGQVARDHGKAARSSDPFKTNTLPRESALESRNPAIDRPTNALIETQRKTYKAPSVIDWKEQRSMNLEQSRSILGR
ncbi:MAG: hypothetical protein RLZZ505_828 [Verrucomicrobiota bacterium]|jgi:hypothetical protein